MRAQLGQRGGNAPATLRKLGARLGTAIEADRRTAGDRQAVRERAADEAEADETDGILHRGNDAPPQMAMSCPVIAAASGDSR
jgi:hypothetical protein